MSHGICLDWNAFVGVAIIVYSGCMLNQWQHHNHRFPPPPDESAGAPLPAAAVVSSGALVFGVESMPAPWFIYAFMGIGVSVCCIALIGHIVAEAINGCCLCFYTILATMFVLLELGLVTFIVLDHNWEKDIPFDPTGELDNLHIFIEENVDVFFYAGIAIVTIQALSLFFAIILRSLVSVGREDDDIEGDYDAKSRAREPLLAPYSSQSFVPARGDSDIWSSRMRDKYGLNSGDAKNTLNEPESIR